MASGNEEVKVGRVERLKRRMAANNGSRVLEWDGDVMALCTKLSYPLCVGGIESSSDSSRDLELAMFCTIHQ